MHFYTFYDKPVLEHTDKIGVILTGLAFGFNSSILPGIDGLRQAFNMDKIWFTVSSWDTEDNKVWVDRIVEEGALYPNIYIDVKLTSLDEIGIYDIWNYIYKELEIGIKGELNVDAMSYKRLIPMIANQIGFEYAYSRQSIGQSPFLKNQYPLLKIKPGCILHHPKDIIAKFIPNIKMDLDFYLKTYSKDTHFYDTHPFDAVYAMHPVASTGYGDSSWITNPTTILKSVGVNLQDTVDRYVKIIKRYREGYWKKIKTPQDLRVFSNDIHEFPLEGTVMMKKFSEFSPTPINYFGSMGIREIIWGENYVKNPWFEIKNGKLKQTSNLHFTDIIYPNVHRLLSI